MDYFIIKQDPDLAHVAKIKDWNKVLSSVSVNTKIAYVEDHIFKEYPDFYETPDLLMAKKFKKVLGLYQSEIEFLTVVLVDKKDKNQVSYDLIRVPTVDCMSSESKTHFDNVSELVLDVSKIDDHRIFKVKGYGNKLIVRLDVAESLLRRGAYGVALEKVKIINGELV